MSDIVAYDLETYPNAFTGVFIDPNKRKIYVFEISDRKDDSKRLRKYLGHIYKNKTVMVGFNSVGFDSPILHKWLRKEITTPLEIFEYAQEIIEDGNNGDKFKHLVPKNKEWLKQLDLYKINHYDNKAKATSLKMIEFNSRSENIEDLPYDVGSILTGEQIDKLIEYNKHDVMETLKFYNSAIVQEAIGLRKELTEKYNIDFTNYNDGKIGKQFFQMKLEDVDPNACYKTLPSGKKVMRQTKRKFIDFNDLKLDYIDFELPQFKALMTWLRKQKITETKGVFSDIEEHDLGELAKYCEMETKSVKLKTKELKGREIRKPYLDKLKTDLSDDERIKTENELYGEPNQKDIDELMKLHPMGWVERNYLKSGKTTWSFNWKIAETLNIVINGFTLVYGTGGIHASVENKTFYSNDEYIIVDYDYASMYPNIFISNRIHPEHLGEEFCDIYKELYVERKKHPKGSNLNKVYKLALNNIYGATNDKYSVFYDPQSTINCTVLGQLTLTNLVEKLVTQVKDLEMIQCNTDGLTVYIKRSDAELVDKIVSDWDKVCGLEMEKVTYKMMAIADVNNYIAQYDSGDLKMNGRYEYRDAHTHPSGQGLDMHQNKSALIIREAAVRCITEGIPVEHTIKKCKDPFDFMLRTKVPRSSRLELRYYDSDGELVNTELQQNITRYFIANNGGKLVKIMPPVPKDPEKEREFGIDASWLAKTCNNMKQFDWDINYDYYISEAKKLVEGVGA